MRHQANPKFWACYWQLPDDIRRLADESYQLLRRDPKFFEMGEPTRDIWFYEHRVPEGQKAYSMYQPIRIEHFKPCAEWWGGAKRKGREESEVAWKVTAEEVKARGYNLDVKNPTHGRRRSR